MFLSIIVKLPALDLSILLVIREKATVPDGPWSATQVSSPILNAIFKLDHFANGILMDYNLNKPILL